MKIKQYIISSKGEFISAIIEFTAEDGCHRVRVSDDKCKEQIWDGKKTDKF
ncbi:MAG: hypothetical protein LBM93_15785 [Oscillospiraceae bacterium]|jgi:hypothetical protein|nr:hypothetical protein [Oscillospiraceae bacterium]